MYKRRILEINGDVSQISLHIVKFPPFKLRALLIEKDPVVWLHALQTYVIYLEFLLYENNVEKLDDMTHNNLCIFVRSYLHEMAEEEARLLSLGMNHEVSEQLLLLRSWVFVLIKKCGLLHLQIFGESLWDLIKYYVRENPDSVRALVDGSLKPQINAQKAQLNRITQVQQHLKHLVESGAFKRVDLKCFENLLSQKSLKANKFAKRFLTVTWLETIEVWWAKGQGRFSNIAKELEIVTLLSVSAEDIAGIAKEMCISSVDTLALYPLFGSLLISDEFHKRVSDLKSTLPFLHFNLPDGNSDDSRFDISPEDISTLNELFPHLTKHQLSRLLEKYDRNVEVATNAVFENPSVADDIDEDAQEAPDDDNSTDDEMYFASSVPKSKMKEADQIVTKHVPDELRNKTLTWALRLMYQGDEDERDDTYDEADVTRSVGKISLLDSDSDNTSVESKKEGSSNYDQIEEFLWQLLKQDKSLFERSKRGSKVRKDMKKEINWSDEQIEGWARMLEKSPQRARILEEKFMFRGNTKTGKRSYSNNKDESIHLDSKPVTNPERRTSSRENTPVDKKRQQARNEKNKSSKANHNRKSGHDKKLSRVGAA